MKVCRTLLAVVLVLPLMVGGSIPGAAAQDGGPGIADINIRGVSWLPPAQFRVVVHTDADTTGSVRLDLGYAFEDGSSSSRSDLTASSLGGGVWSTLVTAGRDDESAAAGGGLASFTVRARAFDGAGAVLGVRSEYFRVEYERPTIRSLEITDVTLDSHATDHLVRVAVYANDNRELGGARLALTVVDQVSLARTGGALDAVTDKRYAEIVAYPDPAAPGVLSATFDVTNIAEEVWARSLKLSEVDVWDWYGNRVYQYSHTEQLGSEAVSIRVVPESIALALQGERRALTVLTAYEMGGYPYELDTTARARFAVRDPLVAYVTAGGEVVARGNGDTLVTVTQDSFEKNVSVMVDSSMTLVEVCCALQMGPTWDTVCLPEGDMVEILGIGSSRKLYLLGRMSDGGGTERVVDLSDPGMGTAYTLAPASSSAVTVERDGYLTARAEDQAVLTATYDPNPGVPGDEFVDTVVVRGVDAPPGVALNAPTAARVGDEIEVDVLAWDDVAVDRVVLLANDLLVGEATVAPYRFVLRIPADLLGTNVILQARAIDSKGQIALSAVHAVAVKAPANRDFRVITRVPMAGDSLVVGITLPMEVTVTLGEVDPWVAAEQVVRCDFLMDGGVFDTARLSTTGFSKRFDPATGQEVLEPMPVWQGHWQIPAFLAGHAAVFQARIQVSTGEVFAGESVVVRLVADQPAALSIVRPGDGAEFPAGSVLIVEGSVADDVLANGARVHLLVRPQGASEFAPSGSAQVVVPEESGTAAELVNGYRLRGHGVVAFSYPLSELPDRSVELKSLSSKPDRRSLIAC